MHAEFESKLAAWRQRSETYLEQQLRANAGDCGELANAMRYSTLGGGKRLRAMLVYATAEAIGLTADDVDAVAAAIEMVHAYSLIHDDLPAMDDDALRRGQATTHIKYNEATAILAGDALQAEAFAVLARSQSIQAKPQTALPLINALAQASGHHGMAGGQQLDLDGEGQAVDLDALGRIHRLKTGALIRACATMPALLAEVSEQQLQQLDCFAENIGLAFQVHDDVLDITGDTATLGKTQGADIERGKATYPALLGLEGAQNRALQLHNQAIAALESFGPAADTLRAIAKHMISRDY